MPDPAALLAFLLLAGLLGALGQGARAALGLAKAQGAIPLQPARLAASLGIGFTAGALAGLLLAGGTPASPGTELYASLVAAGYAGTDLIEGLVQRFLPGASRG